MGSFLGLFSSCFDFGYDGKFLGSCWSFFSRWKGGYAAQLAPRKTQDEKAMETLGALSGNAVKAKKA